MVLVCAGPNIGTLELSMHDDDEAEVYQVETGAGTVIVLRSDVLRARHLAQNSILFSCFMVLTKANIKRSENIQLSPVMRNLQAWAMNRLEELKDEEDEYTRADVPRDWLIAMNHQCFKGQPMACRGAGIRHPTTWDPDTWFRATLPGTDFVEAIPLMRWNYENQYDANPECWRYYKTYQKHVAFMDGADLFDSRMFAISPGEARVMDPQQRIQLEVGYEALWHAGYKKGQIMHSIGGVYMGYGSNTSDFGHVERSNDSGAEGSFGATGGSAAITANRFSFCLGMKGPSMAIDAEDASALLAVHLGCEGLQAKGKSRANEFSVCGGLKIHMSSYFWPQKQAIGALSATGRCMTFNASADGYVHGDGATNLIIKQMTNVVDGKLIMSEGQHLVGVVAGSAVNFNGRNSQMGAPHSPAEQECIALAVRGAGLSGFDVNMAEAYGPGGYLSDAVEVSSFVRTLRLSEDCDDPITFTACKSRCGNQNHATGASSILQTMQSNQYGVAAPNCHLKQMNPHIDAWDQPMNFLTEMLEFEMRSTYSASFARSLSGMNACGLTWGRVDRTLVTLPSKPRERTQVVFWPGGGGRLDGAAGQQPRKGFHIAGTFTSWQPEPMEMEVAGVYGYTVILSDNRWEEFQIWVDGDSKKCLFPEEDKAPKQTKVSGPNRAPPGRCWRIEGRTWTVPTSSLPALTGAPGDGGELVATDGTALVEVGGVDRGLIGAKYRVRLHIAGRFRMVDWERLSGKTVSSEVPAALEAALALPESEYFISSDFCDWGLAPMAKAASSDPQKSTYAFEVHLLRQGGEFQIVQNRDWGRVLYPSTDYASSARPQDVEGPDCESGGRAWLLDGMPGDVFTIEFLRDRTNARDHKQVTWTKTSTRDLSEDQHAELSRKRYAVFGTWDDGERLRGLRWNGEYFYIYVILGANVLETFQIVQDYNWDRIFYPSKADACPGVQCDILGPVPCDGRSQGMNWCIGKEGYEAEGDIYEVRVYDEAAGGPWGGRFVKTVEWKRVPTNTDLKEADAAGLLIRRGR